MKSLKLLAVVALLGAFFTSCEAESLNDEQQIEKIDVFSGTDGEADAPEDPDDDGDN